MKNEKGMSLIMVVLSIILIVAAIIGVLYFAREEYIKYKLETLKTNMVTIQVKVKVLSEEVNAKKEGVSYIGQKLSENIEDEDVKNLIDKNIISQEDENYEEFYILNEEDLTKLKFSNSSIKKVIVNYKTYEIIYVDGFKVNDSIYFKLSDFNSLNNENVEQKLEEETQAEVDENIANNEN